MMRETTRRTTHHERQMKRHPFWWAVAIVIAAWLLWMTMRGSGTVNRDLAPIIESQAAQVLGTHLLISILGNIVVFVPLGAVVALALADLPLARRIGWSTMAGAGLSAAIEFLQMALPSRWSDPADWLLNTVGAALGAFVATVFRKYLQRKV